MFDPTAIYMEAAKVIVSSAVGLLIGARFINAPSMKQIGEKKTSQDHNCRFSPNLEETVGTLTNEIKTRVIEGLSEIFKRLAGMEDSLRKNIEDTGDIKAELAEIRHRTAWLEEKTDAVEVTSLETGKKFVLLVDDRAELMEGIADVLKDSGYYVNKAISYADALTELRNQEYGFAIIDACLSPNTFDGVQLASVVLSQYPNTHVIIWSGHNEIRLIPPGAHFIKKGNFMDVLRKIREIENGI